MTTDRLVVTTPDDVQLVGDLTTPESVEPHPATLSLSGSTLTHLLRRHAGRPGLDSYPQQLSQQVDAGLVETVASWTSDR